MLHAAPYLERLNRGVLQDARLHVILDDAQDTLLTSVEQYDLIVSEPSNARITLFTDEFYTATRKHLSPGGMLVQWAQAYSLAPYDLKMILATLVTHFSDVTLWHSAGPDYQDGERPWH